LRQANNRFTKIVATLGPATMNAENPEAALSALVEAGVDVFRLNFSHDPHDLQQKKYDLVRKVSAKYGRHIAVLADMQGPKLRIGRFKDGKVELKKGQSFRVDLNEELGDENRVNLPHPELFASASVGTEILLDDGKLKLVVKEISKDFAVTEVLVGGFLSDRKGFNVPNAILKLSALTEKDRKDLDYALNMGADYIAVSFVQTPDDVQEAKDIIKGRALIVSKIEKPSAITHIEKIVELSDVVMVARGDLAVETSHEVVPILKRKIMVTARRLGRPVIVATQMLESMISSPVPTRAEVSDVAAAVYEGADAVMLSAESASGKYPTEAVQTMNNVISEIEAEEIYSSRAFDVVRVLNEDISPSTDTEAICAAAAKMSRVVGAKALATYTFNGNTAATMSKYRPGSPIIALTPNEATARKLAVFWGVNRVIVGNDISLNDIENDAAKFVKTEKIANSGDKIIIAAGEAISHVVGKETANLLSLKTLD